MVKLKKYYNAGIDNMLMAAVVVFIAAAFMIDDFNDNYEAISCTTMLICLWLAIRLNDACMAIASFAAALIFFFLLHIKLGLFGRLTVPFAVMIFSSLVYLLMQTLLSKHKLVTYKYCMQWVTLLSIITFYAAGNYFVVNEININMFATPASMGWLFWILTLAIPLLYIFYGLKKKQGIFYRTGFVLMAATVLTVHYYYAVMPAEAAMIIFGILLTTLSYALIKYLDTPKKGFAFGDTGHADKNLLDAEALIIAQVFGKKSPVQNDRFQFGGGSSGGAGASGNY